MEKYLLYDSFVVCTLDTEIAKEFIKYIDKKNYNLVEFCKYDDIDTVEFLIECGISPNTKNENGNSPLEEACLNDYNKLIKLLINEGANVNEGNSLCYAIDNNNVTIIELLLKHGADPFKKIDGVSAYDEAKLVGNECILNHK